MNNCTSNYNTSRDYELLWELAKTQDLICFCDWNKQKNFFTCKKVSANLISMRPFSEFSINDNSKERFLSVCKEYNLEFIIPNAWISVKDRLPEKYTSVLAFAGIVHTNYIINDEKWILEKSVTHWQPLPMPPKGE